MRAITLGFVLASLASPAVAQEPYVDLNRPGALDALARDNPRHYEQVVQVTRVASKVSCETELGMMPVPTTANRMECVAMAIMTSDPPKRRITFQIDHTRYGMVVTLDTPAGRLLPAR
jgi:hypothetical protein